MREDDAVATAPTDSPSQGTTGAGTRRPRKEDLLDLAFVSEPQLAPDGRTVAAVVTTIVTRPPEHRRAHDEQAQEPAKGTGPAKVDGAEKPPRYRSRVHLFAAPATRRDGEQPSSGRVATYPDQQTGPSGSRWLPLSGDGGREFTQNECRDLAPRFSPDGSRLAFLRVAAEKEPPQLYVMQLAGGEPVRLTSHESGVGEFAWHPSGQSLVYVSRGNETDEVGEKGAGRRIRRLRYRGDGEGFLPEAGADLYLVDLASEVRRLTTTPAEQAFGAPSGLAFAPDGARLYFCRTNDEPSFEDFRADVCALDLDSLVVSVLAPSLLRVGGLAVSPSGAYLSLSAAIKQDDLASGQGVWVIDLAPGSTPSQSRLLSGELDVGPAEASDSRYGRYQNTPMWVRETGHGQGSSAGSTEALLINVHRDGATGLARLLLDGRVEEDLDRRGERRAVTAYDALAEGGVAFVAEAPTRPGELWFRTPGGEEHRLSAANDEWCARLELACPQGPFALDNDEPAEPAGELAATGDVEYWTLSPAVPRPDAAVVLEVHGGPHTAYGNGFVFEFQLLAAHGYHVVYGNPRGSSSYGHHFATCLLGAYGSIDADDVLAIATAAVERLGVGQAPIHLTGGSYGGFMTNWLVGVSDRFKSAVSQRSISNWTSMYGTSDIGPSFVERELCGVPWRDVELLWRQSPLRNAAAVVTPLLLIHAEEDYRCPIEQAEQFFSAIKRQGTNEVELLRFPGEGHELSRSGRPDRRLQRLEAIVDWFDRHG